MIHTFLDRFQNAYFHKNVHDSYIHIFLSVKIFQVTKDFSNFHTRFLIDFRTPICIKLHIFLSLFISCLSTFSIQQRRSSRIHNRKANKTTNLSSLEMRTSSLSLFLSLSVQKFSPKCEEGYSSGTGKRSSEKLARTAARHRVLVRRRKKRRRNGETRRNCLKPCWLEDLEKGKT